MSGRRWRAPKAEPATSPERKPFALPETWMAEIIHEPWDEKPFLVKVWKFDPRRYGLVAYGLGESPAPTRWHTYAEEGDKFQHWNRFTTLRPATNFYGRVLAENVFERASQKHLRAEVAEQERLRTVLS